jgi:rod shape-determining protein MreC
MKFSKKILIFIIFGILITLFLNFYQKEFKNFIFLISKPIQRFFWRLGDRTSDFFTGILKAGDLKREIENLKKENEKLLQELVLLKEIERENERLRKALGIGLEKDFKLIFANVIGKEISKNVFKIDRGSKDGVKKDFPVITEEKVLCGRIFEVFDDFSNAQLLSEKSISFTVKIQGFENVFFKARGDGNLKINLEFIPKDLEIKEGDLVLTSAEAGIFPKYLLVGKIAKVEKSDLEPFQKAKIESFCQIENLESIFIIKEW